MTETMTILVHALIISQIDTAMMYWMWLTTFICVSFKQSSMLQQDWLPVNGNMTAYRLQSGTSCIGYQSVNGSSSRRVFSCTTAWAIYHPAICPACVSQSLSTPAADAYDMLHVVTSSSHPEKQSATALVASPSQDQLCGTRCRHHSMMTNCLSLHFTVYSRLNFSAEHTTLL